LFIKKTDKIKVLECFLHHGIRKQGRYLIAATNVKVSGTGPGNVDARLLAGDCQIIKRTQGCLAMGRKKP